MSSILYFVYVVVLLFGIIQLPKFVAARFCEGGHICSLPRECCTQGCCPPYQSGPRQLPPPSEHVLNLFFISHWFFWCVVVAIILALLCAYSLWKKRRTLCGWGFPEHHPQSEGDSAGSCYAPPQYSRCNSFHHPPPPYTEVTSKPDLYPLVFTCNSDNGKNGSSYLMVQYFRNYIVRPAGSLSATSTVDSLSSSFICNANEANTLVPPPYSRAASPEIGFSSHHFPHTQYMMPRSASQLVCAGGQQDINGISNIATQQVYQHQGRAPHYTVVAINGAVGGGMGHNSASASPYNTHLRTSESGNLHLNDDSGESCRSGSVVSGNNSTRDHCGRLAGFIQSQSDQHFRYIANSNSSISDIFVSNSCNVVTSGGITNDADTTSGQNTTTVATFPATMATAAVVAHPQSGGTPVIYSNGCIIKPNPLQRTNTNPTQFAAESPSNRDPVYNSCNSIAGISLAVPVSANRTETEFRDLHMLRRSFETCCQMLQPQNVHSASCFTNGGDSPLRMNELTKKYADEALRSYVTSGTCSGVSSLANIGTPSSPPQATSPTGEVKEILDQIRQLQADTSYEDIIQLNKQRPTLCHTMSSPSPTNIKFHSTDSQHSQLQRYATMSEQPNSISATSPTNSGITDVTIRSPVSPNSSLILHKLSMSSLCSKPTSSSNIVSTSKRPSTLQQTKKKFYSPKPNKAMYIPMTANPSVPSSNRCILKSPVSSVVGANFFSNRGRVRKIWISRSAPTTPGTGLPPNRLGDDSPLLNEHEEDPEGEQNEEMD